MRLYSATSNRMSIVALVCFVLLPVPVAAQRPAVDAPDQAVLDLFAGYPDSYDLRVIVYSHARREPMEKSGVAFYSTWFLHGSPRVAMATIVNNDGQVFTYPLPNSQIDRTRRRWKQLPNVDVPVFLATVRTLPETTSGVALANLVIVSFRSNGQWQTRLYDRKKAPTQLANIYRLAQSALDTN